jgi:hypothetical protein
MISRPLRRQHLWLLLARDLGDSEQPRQKPTSYNLAFVVKQVIQNSHRVRLRETVILLSDTLRKYQQIGGFSLPVREFGC